MITARMTLETGGGGTRMNAEGSAQACCSWWRDQHKQVGRIAPKADWDAERDPHRDEIPACYDTVRFSFLLTPVSLRRKVFILDASAFLQTSIIKST